MGLMKHVGFVEGVWFDQAVTGRSYAEIGIATSPARSFALRTSDTIVGVQAEYRRRWERSRRTMAELSYDDRVAGRGRSAGLGAPPASAGELAHHAGHADILREQVLARRSA